MYVGQDFFFFFLHVKVHVNPNGAHISKREAGKIIKIASRA